MSWSGMAIFTDNAVCLRKLDYSETSQVLTLFTAGHGLVRVIAKGQKRSTKTKVGVGVDLLEWGRRSGRRDLLRVRVGSVRCGSGASRRSFRMCGATWGR